MSALSQIILRQTTDPNYQTKGSALTFPELDDNIKLLADCISESLAGATAGIDPYSPTTEYSSGDFVTFGNNTWEYVNVIPSTGNAPDINDNTYWEIRSVGAFSHLQNTDTGTNSNSFSIGDGQASTKEIEANTNAANKPKLRYNTTTSTWQFSNDGTTFTDIGTGAGATPDIENFDPVNIVLDNDKDYNKYTQTGPITMTKGVGTFRNLKSGSVLFVSNGGAVNWPADFASVLDGKNATLPDFTQLTPGCYHIMFLWKESENVILVSVLPTASATPAPQLDTPTNLMVTNIDSVSNDISFDGVVDAEEYDIEVSDDNVTFTLLTTLANSGVGTKQFTHTGLQPSDLRYYRVLARDTDLILTDSDYTSVVSETTKAAYNFANGIEFVRADSVNMQLQNISGNSITADWTYYLWYRPTSADWSSIGTQRLFSFSLGADPFLSVWSQAFGGGEYQINVNIDNGPALSIPGTIQRIPDNLDKNLIVVVKDSSLNGGLGGIMVYHNGVLVGQNLSNANASTPTQFESSCYYSRNPGGLIDYVNGVFGESGWIENVVLTQQQILEEYNVGFGGDFMGNQGYSFAFRHLFNEAGTVGAPITVAQDESANNVDANLINAAGDETDWVAF